MVLSVKDEYHSPISKEENSTLWYNYIFIEQKNAALLKHRLNKLFRYIKGEDTTGNVPFDVLIDKRRLAGEISFGYEDGTDHKRALIFVWEKPEVEESEDIRDQTSCLYGVDLKNDKMIDLQAERGLRSSNIGISTVNKILHKVVTSLPAPSEQ